MEIEVLRKIITAVCECQDGGFGYIESFMNVLNDYRQDLNIGAGAVAWSIKYRKKLYNNNFFLNETKINLDSFRIDKLSLIQDFLDSRNDDLSAYKNTSEFDNNHIIVIPILFNKKNEIFLDIHGVIILISTSTINISCEELKTIKALLSCQSPSTVDNPNVVEAIKRLVSEDISIKKLTLKDRHRTLNKALDILACKDNNKYRDHGLRHFSFWSVDNVNRIYASKEFNKNTTNDKVHSNTVTLVVDDSHYIYSYAKYLREESITENIAEMINILGYDEFKDSIKDKEYFKDIGIVADNGMVIIAPIRFESYSSICCFYVRDIIYSPFISISFIEEFVNAIKQRIILVNEINIKNILSRMMSLKSGLNDVLNYYSKVVNILKDGNEAKDCLIYLHNSRKNRFLLLSVEDEENSSTIQQQNIKEGNISFYLPKDYLSDHSFVDFLKEALDNNQNEFLYERSNGKVVKTACFSQISDKYNQLCGFVLLINKHHEMDESSKGVYFHDTFYYNNVYITSACYQYLLLYRNLEFSILRRDELLKKYRHEMPKCIQVINNNIRIIKDNYTSPLFRMKKLERYANDSLVNCKRIDLLASFFSAIDFDEGRLLRQLQPFKFGDFLKFNSDTFREEGMYRGISLYFDIGIDTPTQYVSLFYELSVTNIIINAIRYSAPGSQIFIKSNSDSIEVIDVGIPIEESEKERIFEEGYRSSKARSVNQNGMGYGLFLSKKIIEAHEQRIEVKSKMISEKNTIAESAIYLALIKMKEEQRKKYLYGALLESEHKQADKLFLDIQSNHKKLKSSLRKFVNGDLSIMEHWLDYEYRFNHLLLDMEEDIFNKPIYKVSFIIHLN